MRFTDRRAADIAAASIDLETLKSSLQTDGSLSSGELSGILTAISDANDAVQTALAMDEHTYESFAPLVADEYPTFTGADRTLIEVSRLIRHDADGEVIEELRFDPPHYIMLSADDTAAIDPIRYLTTRW